MILLKDIPSYLQFQIRVLLAIPWERRYAGEGCMESGKEAGHEVK